MTSIAENRLHADPGIEGHGQHPRRSARARASAPHS